MTRARKLLGRLRLRDPKKSLAMRMAWKRHRGKFNAGTRKRMRRLKKLREL